MKYMGSKNRVAGEIIALTQQGRRPRQWYVEPFVGGGNMIDKVKGNCLGADSNKYTIAALKLIRDYLIFIPRNNQEFTENDYRTHRLNKENHSEGIVGYCGFALSYGGRFFEGWCRDSVGERDYVTEAYCNAVKQSPKLQHVSLLHRCYQDLDLPNESIIYCDPPYAGAKSYKDGFDHNKFWQWCRRKSDEGHTVYISEYAAPEDFECIWEKEIASSLTKNTGAKKGTERLFIYGDT